MKCLLIICLLVAQIFAQSVISGQSVLCIHEDGSSFIESSDESIQCHATVETLRQAGLWAAGCIDFVNSDESRIQLTRGDRNAAIQLLQLCQMLPLRSGFQVEPVFVKSGQFSRYSFPPSDGVLDSLTTVIITV